jgi:putative pyruvate formate lyase activating enzyme
MGFLAREVSTLTYVNIMPQYRPCGKSYEVDGIQRPISREEYLAAIGAARGAGLSRIDNE